MRGFEDPGAPSGWSPYRWSPRPSMQAARVVARAARGHLLHPDDARLTDGGGEFLDLATGQFGSDASLAGIVQFEFDGLEVDDHGRGTFSWGRWRKVA